MVLQLEDYYEEPALYKGDRKITHVILSNKINMEQIIIVEREKAREAINQIVKEKLQQKELLMKESRLALEGM